MKSIWYKDGEFAGIGEVARTGNALCNFFEVRFEDGRVGNFNAVADGHGMRFLAPEERPDNATDDGASLHQEWLSRRGPKPFIEGASREIDGHLIHVCEMTKVELKQHSYGWDTKSGYEYVALAPLEIETLNTYGERVRRRLENGSRIVVERMISVMDHAGDPWDDRSIEMVSHAVKKRLVSVPNDVKTR